MWVQMLFSDLDYSEYLDIYDMSRNVYSVVLRFRAEKR